MVIVEWVRVVLCILFENLCNGVWCKLGIGNGKYLFDLYYVVGEVIGMFDIVYFYVVMLC